MDRKINESTPTNTPTEIPTEMPGDMTDVSADTPVDPPFDVSQDTPQGEKEPDFPELALFLAQSYGQMLKDRAYLKSVIDAGVKPYTKEMAIEDLTAVSIDYESDRVQTSNISNVPQRVIELLDAGYVEKMNRRLRRDMEETVKDYAYLCWKIEVVETAMRERMDKKERAIFERIFVRGKSYREICKAYKKGNLQLRQVNATRSKSIQMISVHLKNAACFPLYSNYMKILKKEYLWEKQTRKEEGDD